ncbi:MAG: C10 family peptidase [Paludibacteraceae bacterium]|nr:C10 family peptidase [Paludibacteraceae bacterium]
MKHILTPLSFILTPLSFLLLPLSLSAAVRTVDEAAGIAVQFTNESSIGPNKAPTTVASLQLVHERAKLESAEPAFYIFNKSNEGGFVIVSGDDRTEDVLGYSNQGSIDVENVNPNLRFWLNLLQEAVSATNDTNVHKAPAAEVTPIDPLLVTKDGKEITWYQEAPYNNLCPKDADGYRSLTGCVATAAAMVMYKWCYPEKGTGTHSYQWTNSSGQKKTLTVDYENTTYDWDNMLPAYLYKSTTTAQKTAVATLMYHAGVACDMQYGSEGSGAFTDDMANGLIKYFGYTVDKFITTYSSMYYPTLFEPTEYRVSIAKFTDYFNADLEEGRPIIMGGEDANNGGHEFVCDGRDENGKFHINWGWEGDGNGYFSLSALRVDGYNFSSNLDAIIGLRPGVVDTIYATSMEVSPQSLTLKMNERQTLTTTFEPQDATDKRVLWSSSDDSIATVSASGVVRGMNMGTALIVATAVDGGWQDTCVVTVTDEYFVSEDFELVTSASVLRVGDDVIIGATYSGNSYCLSNYMSGTTKTTYAKCENVSVVENVITLPQETNVAVFRIGIQDGAWTFTNADGQKLSASGNKKLDLDQTVPTWFVDISETNAATLASTQETYGQIYYNNNNNDPRFSIYSTTTMSMRTPNLYARYNSKPDKVVPVTGIVFEKEQDSVYLGQELTLAYTLLPENATNTAIRWSSSDTSVVTLSSPIEVGQEGTAITIQAIALGEAVITARTLDGGYVATCLIKVIEDHTALDQTPSTKHRTPYIKHIENGQIFILRDGIRWNVLGVRITD